MEWLKHLLYGQRRSYNSVYYSDTAPNPKQGWLRKSALRTGDLWFDPPHFDRSRVWSDGAWKEVGNK